MSRSAAHESSARPAPASLGQPERRVDGPVKVTGKALYTADRHMPGELVARFLPSPEVHARIVDIDVTRAAVAPGVHAVITGRDIGPLRMGRQLQDWPVLAFERVRFVGEHVAAVAAETAEAAEAALALIHVDYEKLPAILDPQAALAPDAIVLHPSAADYVYLAGARPPIPHPNVQGHRVITKGAADLEPIFAAAAHVFEHRFTVPPLHAGYLEPHATLVWIDDEDQIHVVTPNKAPFNLRSQMSQALGIPSERIVIEVPHVGGDFGGKGLTIDEYACLFLAQKTGRPIRAVTSPSDDLAYLNPRHAALIRLRTAVDADGRFLAHDARVLLDGGAYAAAKPLPNLTLSGASNTLPAYAIPNVRIEITVAYTNHAPAGHVRAPGEVQALFAGESHVDEIARALGRDPLQFRLLNAVRGTDTGLDGTRFHEPRAVEVLETIRREASWEESLPDGAGRGVALCVRHIGGGKSGLRVRCSPDGRIRVVTGAPDQGGGVATVIQRVMAAELLIPEASIEVVHGSTAEAPFDSGVGASRATHLASRAATQAAMQLIDELEERAEPRLGHRVDFEAGYFVDPDGHRLAFDEIAAVAIPDGFEFTAMYEAAVHAEDEPAYYSFSGYSIEVEVDRETGMVRVRDALLVADVGAVINPVAHRGQLLGGFAFGIGAALTEELVRADGQVVTANFGDMRLPVANDVPPLRIVELPTSLGPGAFGAKMAGELSNTAVAPAIANAVRDAVAVRVTSLPIKPEAVLRGLLGG
ncbi:MAG TPA: xanthine dehydrogenase family protein molybdopterin-binding subunit [Candidatus Limnocylindrales bacterium]|nr:xanthine dehydrogenase family protein molybdopterin-binding subunit [Candidatus Limnocylindrales bacterium]